MLVNYWVIKCNRCGKYGVKSSKKPISKVMYLCKFCNSRTKMKRKEEFGLTLLVIGPIEHPHKAAKVCQAYNEKMATERPDFKSRGMD